MSTVNSFGRRIGTPGNKPGPDTPTRDAAGVSLRDFLEAGVITGSAAVMGGSSLASLSAEQAPKSSIVSIFIRTGFGKKKTESKRSVFI